MAKKQKIRGIRHPSVVAEGDALLRVAANCKRKKWGHNLNFLSLCIYTSTVMILQKIVDFCFIYNFLT